MEIAIEATIEVAIEVSQEAASEPTSYVEQNAADFVLFCDTLSIDAQPDNDTSSHQSSTKG